MVGWVAQVPGPELATEHGAPEPALSLPKGPWDLGTWETTDTDWQAVAFSEFIGRQRTEKPSLGRDGSPGS
jgi:hypothetical protein